MSEQAEQPKRPLRELNAMVRALVEQETLGYPFWVGGYVSHLYLSNIGHIYFYLVDEDYSIHCMIREPIRGTLDFTPVNGMDIEVLGSVRVYDKKAQVQIDVQKARTVERPRREVDTSALKALEQKGLWPRNKKPIPQNIQNIGLVTSKHSDALHDFEDTYRSDDGKAAIKLKDVRLQGQQAAGEIAEAIERLNREKIDLIVLTRGGGKASELAVFDDVRIAEAICRSKIPIVTGIGHQRDETIADQVADYSAITPTAAASFLAKKRLVEPIQSTKPTQWGIYLLLSVGLVLLVIVALLLLNQ